jgi:hypothetical protein
MGGWREPYEQAGGLLLEYVSLLTTGQRLQEVITAQVQARERDHTRHAELDIARLVACAHQFGATLPASTVATQLGLAPSAFAAALRRLVHEHLVTETGDGMLAGLHEARSAALAQAANPTGQLNVVIGLVQLVPTAELNHFLRRALAAGIDEQRLRLAAAERVRAEPTGAVLVSVAAAWRRWFPGRLAQDSLDIVTRAGVPASHAHTALMLSRTAPNPEFEARLLPSIHAALAPLRQQPTTPDLSDLLDTIGWSTITAATAELACASERRGDAGEALVSLLVAFADCGAPLVQATRGDLGTAVRRLPITKAARLLEAIALLDPATASAIADSVGPQQLLDRVVAETAWLAELRLVEASRSARDHHASRRRSTSRPATTVAWPPPTALIPPPTRPQQDLMMPASLPTWWVRGCSPMRTCSRALTMT